MDEPMLILGAIPEDVYSTNTNVYFLDKRVSSSNDRFFEKDITNKDDMESLLKDNAGKFATIIFDVGVWHHLFENGGSPQINIIAMLLRDGGKLYLPQTKIYTYIKWELKLNEPAIKRRDDSASKLLVDAGLDVEQDIDYTIDIFSNRKHTFIVGVKTQH